jgi:hypothetical protein
MYEMPDICSTTTTAPTATTLAATIANPRGRLAPSADIDRAQPKRKVGGEKKASIQSPCAKARIDEKNDSEAF